MRLLNTSDNLPTLRKEAVNQRIDKKKISKLAEEVKKILKKEGRLNTDENISPSRNAYCY